ncbi:hypothetical protein O1611_g9984 [Lasiodiplodia mahajangana]|uniref:Uncharacterized protein n=1 Tax=Lasiodiplodia mahajangana TaxID=1108764 RepID=A0ACC2J316_9PEZI|nr:hypothetical protein O1611_g9984 [Lasiodiplodia mahajangana]
MAPPHDPQKPNRGYFVHPRSLPTLPPGYNWEEQIEKYSSAAYMLRIEERNTPQQRNPFKNKDEFYRTGLDRNGRPNKTGSNFNRLTGVFCHRGLYDLAMKVPQNSGTAIDNGLLHNFRLHELDVRMDASRDPRMAFLAHDQSGARDTVDRGRWSQGNASSIAKASLIIRGINLLTNEFASTFQSTEAKVPRLEILDEYNQAHGDANDNFKVPNFTFQLDMRDQDFAPMLAWLRKRDFGTLSIMLKGYSSKYASGADLLRQVEQSTAEDSGLLVDVLEDQEACFTSVAVGDDNTKAISGSEDGTVRIWDLVKGEVLTTLRGHTGPITSVATSRHQSEPAMARYSDTVDARFNLGASTSLDKTVRLWNLATGKSAGTLRGHSAPVTCVAFGSTLTDVLVASGSLDHTVQIYSATTTEKRLTLRGHTQPVTSVAFADEVAWVASGSQDCTVRIWHQTTGELVHTLKGHSSPVTSIAFCPHVVERKNTPADVYDAVIGRVLPVAAAFIPDRIVTGCEDGTTTRCQSPRLRAETTALR